ncbi:MAG: hypothetical protein NZ518_11420, partial [Dehalococcoidia bacterium]|nr:hypothetical protein [Dehalococcoidia bacterium]
MLSSWSFDPPVAIGLALFVALYARGVRRLSRRGGFARHFGGWRLTAMILAIATLVVALFSPIAV